MKEKKISVIVPCYNVSKFIHRCVKSLVDQTIGIDELECIFVDDASTDDTLEKLFSWEKKFPESILVVPCQENHKQGAARNAGLSYATGEYIAFLDSDDYVDARMYEAMYQKAVELKCDVVGSFFARETRDGRQLYRDETQLETEKLVVVDTRAKRRELMVNGLPSGVNTRLYRRNLIADHQLLFPEDIQYEDNYWGAILLGFVSSYYIMDACFYHYVVNESSTVMEKNAEHHLDRLVIEVMKVEKYKEDGTFQEYHDEIEFNFLRLFFINTIRILFVRFDQIPYQIIYDMQRWVRELFPDYQVNPYLEKLPPLQMELLKIIQVDLTPEKIEILAQGYRSVLR
ncbi:MAG: glycosyltransferase family 2 protein [Lachnospiraceae bacterium]|nr:glycosyltransferase family 2 protein [Lachnospiraceae bacterium]